MATSHTAGPWRLNLRDPWIIEDAKGRRVAEMRNDCGPTAPTRKANDERDSICRANAAFIVEACNSHDELLQACTLALRDAENHPGTHPLCRQCRHNRASEILRSQIVTSKGVTTGSPTLPCMTTGSVIECAHDDSWFRSPSHAGKPISPQRGGAPRSHPQCSRTQQRH
jgi:hypothetical protein